MPVNGNYFQTETLPGEHYALIRSTVTPRAGIGSRQGGVILGNRGVSSRMTGGVILDETFFLEPPVCTENLIRVDGVMESPKLAE